MGFLEEKKSGLSRHKWSPRGHILKSLASKVKSLVLASKPQDLENYHVLGSWTSLFFELLKFCRPPEKIFGTPFILKFDRNICLKTFFLRSPLKIFLKTFFFGEHLRLCPWRMALSIPVLGQERVCSWKGCPGPWRRIFCVSLALSLVSSTPPLFLGVKGYIL